LVALRLQHCGSEQGDLLTQGNTAEDLAVVEIADSEADNARRVFIALLHKYVHRATGATRPARSRARRSATSEAARTAAAPAAAEAPAG
jgi:hypothetical protein